MMLVMKRTPATRWVKRSGREWKVSTEQRGSFRDDKSNEAVLHVLSESFYAAEQLTTARRDLFRKEGSKITFSFTELKYGTFWIYMKNV